MNEAVQSVKIKKYFDMNQKPCNLNTISPVV